MVNTGIINYWITGTLADNPLYSWFKSGNTNIQISAKAISNQTTINANNFTQEETNNLPLLTLLQIQLAHIISMETIPGEIRIDSAPETIVI